MLAKSGRIAARRPRSLSVKKEAVGLNFEKKMVVYPSLFYSINDNKNVRFAES
jgi:hypothetical protein